MFEDSKQGKCVLRSETYLTADHEPGEPVGRESEIDRIARAVKPLAKRQTPENLLVHGPAGVGKTTTVKHVFNRLEQESRVKSVYINCWQYNTRPSLLTELLIRLGYPAPRKGKPVDELLAKLREWLDKNRGVAVALDEFDQLEEDTEVIYDLQLLNQEAEKQIGVVMVSNQNPRNIQLDPRSRSRLHCQTVQFEPYTAQQLERILRERVEQAFRAGTVPNEVVEEIAECVAAESGDCREALSLLLQVGRAADREGRGEVSTDDL